jgi:2Fe-2S ferredoxin
MKHRVFFASKAREVMVRQGDNILMAALSNRVAIRNRCNGNGTCTTCKVEVIAKDQHFASSPSTQEMKMLGEEQLHKGLRLACQTRVYGPLQVHIPEESWKARIKEQQSRKEDEGRK